MTDRYHDLPDVELVERMAGRDADALAELYERYAAMLLGLTRRIVHDRSDAEEVLQETFFQAWSQAGRYQQSRSSVPTWLVLIARSRGIDRLRSSQSRDRALNALGQEAPPSHTSALAVGNVLLHQRRQHLRRELAALPAEQRQVLELAFFHGLSQSEIANHLAIPLGTVKTRTLLAMKKLRAALRDTIEELL